MTYFDAIKPLPVLFCVCIYSISVSIDCVSQDKLSLIASYQQIYGFFKGVVFEKKRHFGK